ncbi:indolethylamine N-methyltransferase-like [Ptychodera flava]|uniref:indolethylamine N-methyltransferase-like n=1 Tax=Ptychodera flava TaxID=63121 RepID=UPI00396A3287
MEVIAGNPEDQTCDEFPTAESYLDHYYSTLDGPPEEQGVNFFLFEHLHRIFHQEGLSGERLIDVGTGPCIYSFVSACTKFKEIVASDYAADNREALKRWIDNEPGCFDWRPVIKHVCELEGHGDVEEREKRIRATIKDVLYCDVHQPNPIAPKVLEPFDCLVTCFCLEATCKRQDDWIQGLRNMATLLRDGGTLVQVAIPLKFYTVDGKRFEGFSADEQFLKSALLEAGFTDLDCHFRKRSVQAGKDTDYEFTVVIKATKKATA